MRRSFFAVLLFLTGFTAGAQTDIRPLPMNINRPSVNLYAPFISGDGETLVYLSDYTEDGHHSMYWATRKGVSEWSDGKEINRLINRPDMNFRGGFSLSFDGDVLFFTSRKSGIGGYDIWYSERQGSDWGAPKNLGKPLNSTSNDASPSLSPDGDYLYFMRCETMSEYGGATGCRLMVSKRTPRGWGEAEELPGNINTGNSQSPRILADDQTLIFSSNAMGGKGELDLFMTRKTASGWTDPVPMAFINTSFNDAFVSVSGKGRYILESMKGTREFQLVERLIPEEFRPARVMRIKGIVAHKNVPVTDAVYTVFDVEKRSRLYQETVSSAGEFSFVLPEGSNYDLAITSTNEDLLYFSKPYRLLSLGRKDKESLQVELNNIADASVISTSLHFEPNGSALDKASDFELRRIVRLLSAHPGMNLRVEIIQADYQEDSIKSNPDLTEIRIDTLWTAAADSIDSLNTSDLRLAYLKNDSAYFHQAYDSTLVALPRSVIAIRHYFHNDRTGKQMTSLREALEIKGVKLENIEFVPVVRKKEEMTTSVTEIDEPDREEVRITVRK